VPTIPVVQDEDVARRVVGLLGDRSIATAESCTAGRVAEVLACVEKAAEFLRGGLVAYQDEIKRELLGVTADSVLTEQAAQEMAEGARRLFGADVTVATTGVAGDEEEEGTPPGTVYIATSVGDRTDVAVHRFDGSPEEVCDQARRQALLDLVGALTAPSSPPT
jgi:nicotinamide-nucleotide amidase